MKIVVGVLVVIAGVGLVSQVYFLMLQKNIEEYRYNVIKKYQSFEVRQYETSLFTSIKLPTKNFKKASSKGFSILAGYIFGDNKKKRKNCNDLSGNYEFARLYYYDVFSA